MAERPKCKHRWVAQRNGAPRCKDCGREAHASPSQIETWGRWQLEKNRETKQLEWQYRGCRRKWKYQRERGKNVQPASAAFGHRTHEIKEAWTKDGTWTPEIAASDEGKCLAAGLHHFAPPGQAIAERAVYRRLPGGALWYFKIDETAEWIPGHSVLVSDLKTTGNLDYVKTPAQLLDDPQRIVYASDAGLTLEVPMVRTRWVYCRRKKPKAVPAEISEATHDAVKRLVVLSEQVAWPMLQANAIPLADFPRDGLHTGECDRWSREGCEFKKECLGELNPVDLLNIRLLGSG